MSNHQSSLPSMTSFAPEPPCPIFSIWLIEEIVSIQTWGPSDICVPGAWPGSIFLLLLTSMSTHLAYSIYRFYLCSQVAPLWKTLHKHHGVVIESAADLLYILSALLYLFGYSTSGSVVTWIGSNVLMFNAYTGSYRTLMKMLETRDSDMGTRRYHSDLKTYSALTCVTIILYIPNAYYYHHRDREMFNIFAILNQLLVCVKFVWSNRSLSRALDALQSNILR